MVQTILNRLQKIPKLFRFLIRDVEPRNYFAVPGSGSDPGSRFRVRVRFRVRGSGFRGSGFGFAAQDLAGSSSSEKKNRKNNR